MKIQLLPSVAGRDGSPHQFLTSYLVEDRVAVDVGSVGYFATHTIQRRITDVFISHTHIDHIASLPVLLENVYTRDDECISVYGSDAVLDCLQRDLFNDRVWPDFIRLSRTESPFVELRELREGVSVAVGDLRVTPIGVSHCVPTFGFLIEDASGRVVISSDTGPTERIWEQAGEGLDGVFLECSFPRSMAELAGKAGHLTTDLFAVECAKIPCDRIVAVHIKAAFHDAVVTELGALAIPGVEVGEPGRVYEFGSGVARS